MSRATPRRAHGPALLPRSASSAASSLPAFDFSFHMRRVCADLCARLAELAHIDMERVA